jgi:hypothetical protein
VSVDGADDRERGDIGDGKAGPAYELVIDQEAFRGGDCGEISLGQRRRSAGEFGPGGRLKAAPLRAMTSVVK